MSRRAISWPISSIGWRTLVSGGRRGRRDRRVVVADDRDVLGDAPPGGGQDGQGAGGHEVGRGEDRVDVGARREQPVHRRGAALLGEVADGLEARVGGDAGVGERLAIAGQPVDAGGHVARARRSSR